MNTKYKNLSPGLKKFIEPEQDIVTLTGPVSAYAQAMLNHTNGGATMQAAL